MPACMESFTDKSNRCDTGRINKKNNNIDYEKICKVFFTVGICSNACGNVCIFMEKIAEFAIILELNGYSGCMKIG